VEKGLPLLAAHVCVGIAEDESNGGEEVTLARTIAPDDDIGPGREGLDDGLILVAARGRLSVQGYLRARSCVSGAPFEALDDNLLDVHLCAGTVDSTTESQLTEIAVASLMSLEDASISIAGGSAETGLLLPSASSIQIVERQIAG
jgi:hypothetical protein